MTIPRVRGFRRTPDAATAVLQYAAVPVPGNAAGGPDGKKPTGCRPGAGSFDL